jgi:hypothetical protein
VSFIIRYNIAIAKLLFVGSALLTPSAYYSCPGERVTFNCVVQNGHKLYWDVDFSDPELSNIESQRFVTSMTDTPGSWRSISYDHGYAFEFNLTSRSNSPALISTASTITEQRLEGTRVSCRDMNVQNTSVIHIVQG